jgi:hypothetical protein
MDSAGISRNCRFPTSAAKTKLSRLPQGSARALFSSQSIVGRRNPRRLFGSSIEDLKRRQARYPFSRSRDQLCGFRA